MTRLLMLVLALLLSFSPAAAQLIPPIYTPLPDSELEAFQSEAERMRQYAADLEARAASLRQSATVSASRGVDVSALQLQVEELTRETELQERTRNTEATRAEVLQGQVDQLRAAAAAARSREAELQAAIDSILALPLHPIEEAESIDQPADSAAPPISANVVPPPSTANLDAGLVVVRREAALHTARADTLTLQVTSARQASDVAGARIATLQTHRSVLAEAVRQANESGTSGAQTAQLLRQEADRLDQERATGLAAAARQVMLEQEARIRPRQGFFPVRNDEEAGRFFGEEQSVQALQNMVAAFAGEVGAGSVNTEIASDYKWGTRISANVIVARAEEELKADKAGTLDEGAETEFTGDADAIRRLVAGGGTFNLIALRPIFYLGNGLDGATIHFVPKFGADMPDDGAPMHAELALLFNGKFQTINQVFQFFGSLKTSGVFGNKPFGEMMGSDAGKSFGYAQYLVGVEVASAVKVLFSGSTGPGAIGRTGALSIQISPN